MPVSPPSSDVLPRRKENSSRSINSPPQGSASCRPNREKEKRQPSITPRKFNRFFTSRSHDRLSTGSSWAALGDITTPVNNCTGTNSSPIRTFSDGTGNENSSAAFTREMKRRKLLHTASPSPEDSGPEKRCLLNRRHILEDNVPEGHNALNSLQHSTIADGNLGPRKQELSLHRELTKHIKQLDSRGLAGRFLQLSLRSGANIKRQCFMYPTSDWQDYSAEFYSGPSDLHFCASIENSIGTLPFVVASCNTNSLVGIGDEEGHVRLLESAKDRKPQFKDVFLAFRPHSNAVIDMCFSLDDSLLATASGDQTARVVDMTTQTTISVLAQHSASLKQVKFQPGAANNSVIATSSRDGSVQIWDLRCTGTQGSVQDIHIPMDPTSVAATRSRVSKMTYGCIVNSIYGAHSPGLHGHLSRSSIYGEGLSKGEEPGRVGDVSVTAINFLPQGREHMLLTASEANASIKLWDVRCLHHTRRKTAPLSFTALPESHNQWRHFGINSLSLGGSGSRLYALCRDSTVYVYSTAHLILGLAPELSTNTPRRRHQQVDIREGLGPLYGLRHQQLHSPSFYVKATIRPAKSGKGELLAVGSIDGCAVLFPTDERYIDVGQNPSEPELTTKPRLQQTGTASSACPRSKDSISISKKGTPLIRGHDREVSSLAWTYDGELITVGDDFLVRCWREGYMARNLRTGGEGGQRWGCGWADVLDSYDEGA